MAAIRLDYPTAASPTASVVLNPAFVVVQPFKRSAFQRKLVSESGVEYVYRVSTNVEHMFEMVITDLHEAVEGSNSGAAALFTFLHSTIEFALRSCQLTDADAVVETVRLWSTEAELREADGLIKRSTLFSGTFLWRRVIT